MGLWNLGSVATEVQTIVDSVPSSLSGTPIERMADRNAFYITQYTGQTVGSTSIATQFQPALLSLTIADVLEFMTLQGGDAVEYQLDEFKIKKGQGSNLMSSSEAFEKQGFKQLENLGRKALYYKANG